MSEAAWPLVIAVLMAAGVVVVLAVGMRTIAAEQGRLREQTERDLTRLRRDISSHENRAADRLASLASTQRRERDLALQQVEALVQLHLGSGARTPLAGRWAMEPVTLLALVDLVEAQHPVTIVELGSGTSTVWLARAAGGIAGARIVALEHDEGYADLTRGWLAREPTGAVAEVRCAALADPGLPGHETPWYRPDLLSDVTDIDLLVIDGPPEATGSAARYPALPLLVDRLAHRAWVLLDDADRPDEQEAVRRWIQDVPGLRRVPTAGARHVLLAYERPAPGGVIRPT